MSVAASTDLPFSGVEPTDGWEYPATEGLTEEEQTEQRAAEAAAVQQEATSPAPVPAPASVAAPPAASAVATPPATPPAPAPGPTGAYPAFEGVPVVATEVVLKGEAKTESLAGLVVSIDDRVRLVGDYRVVSVHHKTNKDGELVRQMTLKASTIELAPWDPSDPNDDGVTRAR